MIFCAKCKHKNKAQSTFCEQCNADLLPGEGIQDRVGNMVVGVVGGLMTGGISYFLITHPEFVETSEICLLTNPIPWLFATFAVPISSIALALRKTPTFTKYENRAKRHVELDAEQALEDFSKALELAPKKEHARLLQQRSTLYTKLGREEDAIRDKLTYTSTEGAYAEQSGWARMIGADKDAYVSTAIQQERKQLLAQGKIKAVGFCKKCGQIVELNEKLSCPQHKKPKPQYIKFAMPSELDSAKAQIEKEIQADLPKKRRVKTTIIVFVLVFIVLCMILPLVMRLLQ